MKVKYTCMLEITGSRDFSNVSLFRSTIRKYLSDIKDEIEIVSGGCSGADTMGEWFAEDNNLKLTVFEADWDKYGRAAGPIRNEQMAKYAAESDRGILIAFPIGKSPGTRNMIKLANQYGLEVYVEE